MSFRGIIASSRIRVLPRATTGHAVSYSRSAEEDVVVSESRKFGAAARTWWDPASTSGAGLLHALNPVRVNYISDVVACQITPDNHMPPPMITNSGFPLRNLRVIDVGCGGGLLSESLARLGARVCAIDPTPAAIEEAARHAAADPAIAEAIDYRCATVYDLVHEINEEKHNSFRDGTDSDDDGMFDLVCCLEVVEHVPEPDRFVAACARLTRPGGALVMSTLNRTLKARAVAIAGAEHLGRFLPVGTHDWSKFRTPEEMAAAMEAGGLVVQDVSGIVYSPAEWGGGSAVSSPRSWAISSDDTDVNYIMFALRDRSHRRSVTREP